ncbi:hypothetical protein MASR2M36_19570 [Providencia sp.]
MANKNYLSIPKIFILFISLFMAGSAYSDPSCINLITVQKTIDGKICFSKKKIPVCTAGCVVESSITKMMQFRCINDINDAYAPVEIVSSCIRPSSKK